jgi:hypothetical protein
MFLFWRGRSDGQRGSDRYDFSTRATSCRTLNVHLLPEAVFVCCHRLQMRRGVPRIGLRYVCTDSAFFYTRTWSQKRGWRANPFLGGVGPCSVCSTIFASEPVLKILLQLGERLPYVVHVGNIDIRSAQMVVAITDGRPRGFPNHERNE